MLVRSSIFWQRRIPRTADSANKSANFNEVAGRSFERLFQLIQGGNMTLDEAKAKAEKLGLTLTDETAAGLEKTGQKADELFASIRGEGIKAFEAWGGAIQGTLSIIEALGAGIGVVAGQISSLTKGLIEQTKNLFSLNVGFQSYSDWQKRIAADAKSRGYNVPGSAADQITSSEASVAHGNGKVAVPALTLRWCCITGSTAQFGYGEG